MSGASVTHWIGQLRTGDQAAAQRLWERYFERLLGLARQKLRHARRVADEQDVAQEAFNSFFRAAQDGRFPQLQDRDSLWRLLVEITVHKALKQLRREQAQKRGGGTVRGESVLLSPADSGDGEGGFEQVLSQEPTPDDAAQFTEDYERRLEQLGEAELKSIAVWALEGYTNAQIAARLGCVESTVERKLRRIRTLWSEEATP
jgi:RNA polymerase sigma factor (sigma-70 family)